MSHAQGVGYSPMTQYASPDSPKCGTNRKYWVPYFWSVSFMVYPGCEYSQFDINAARWIVNPRHCKTSCWVPCNDRKPEMRGNYPLVIQRAWKILDRNGGLVRWESHGIKWISFHIFWACHVWLPEGKSWFAGIVGYNMATLFFPCRSTHWTSFFCFSGESPYMYVI